MYCGFCGATHSAVEHREEGVEAFRQQRVRENRFYAFGSVRKLSGPITEAYQGPDSQPTENGH
jgi:hypothetical protein